MLKSLRRTGSLISSDIFPYSVRHYDAVYYFNLDSKRDRTMDINKEIAAEFRQGEREAVLMAVLMLAFFSFGIIMITGG